MTHLMAAMLMRQFSVFGHHYWLFTITCVGYWWWMNHEIIIRC